MLFAILNLIVMTLIFEVQPIPLIDSDRLPGLNDMESGFDAISMTSLSEKISKFRIFDLSDKGPYPFTVNVGGKERIYNTPLYVQVTDVNTRREVNCEDLSTSFSQFYSNYFRSTRSSSGWSFLFFGGSTQRHATLQRISDAINKNSQAVGTSTSWWGLYSIQLGPPFIIKLDPLFNATMAAIVSRPIPTTDAEQTVYNVLVETYGTHYITYAIVGAVAHIYSLINEAYSKTSTYEEIRTQVGRMGSFLFFSGGSIEQSNSLYQSMTEEYRKNTRSFAEYQPPVAQVVGKTEWQSWIARATEHPLVVNRTVAPLSNLFYAYPQVQTHVRRTIDYYLMTGTLPTIAQLRT